MIAGLAVIVFVVWVGAVTPRGVRHQNRERGIAMTRTKEGGTAFLEPGDIP